MPSFFVVLLELVAPASVPLLLEEVVPAAEPDAEPETEPEALMLVLELSDEAGAVAEELETD